MSNVILTMDPSFQRGNPPRLPLWRNGGIPIYGVLEKAARGTMGVFDRGWYQELAFPSHALHLEQKELQERLKASRFLSASFDDGYLILKFFLHHRPKGAEKGFDKLLSSKDTAWRVSLNDLEQNRRYDEYYQIIDGILEETNTDY